MFKNLLSITSSCIRWVPFVLFLQCLMFYAPHMIYKALEGGKVWITSANDFITDLKANPILYYYEFLTCSE